MIILAIETSCDETAISLLKAQNDNLQVLSNAVSSQVKIHSRWGGVVPNLAAREHLKNIFPLLKHSLEEAKIKPPQDIDLIAVTQGPGLIPALLIGNDVAKTLSYLWEKPLIGIHHIEGHIYANFIREIKNQKSKIKNNIGFPILCLVVSGGHTQLVLMEKHLDYKIVGQTLDDAAGEAFDKVARMLKLGYPGGPIISRLAARGLQRKKTRSFKFQVSSFKINLPRPMIASPNFNFSFSGLKTAVLYTVEKNKDLLEKKEFVQELCQEFQQAVIDVLVAKTIKAAKEYNPRTVMLAGGVSANKELRKQLGNAIGKNLKNTSYIIPDFSYSVDNAAMIAAAGYYRWKSMDKTRRKQLFQTWKLLQADANLKLK